MGEMLKQGSVFGEQFPQHRFAVILIARPENMMMRAGDNTDCIKLDKTELPDHAVQVERSSRRCRQTLRIQPEASCFSILYAQLGQLQPHLAHGEIAHDFF